jgi:hypothetical protein
MSRKRQASANGMREWLERKDTTASTRSLTGASLAAADRSVPRGRRSSPLHLTRFDASQFCNGPSGCTLVSFSEIPGLPPYSA